MSRISRPILILLLVACLPTMAANAAGLSDYGPVAISAGEIQRPGAVVWMDLLTDDVPAAVRFYHEVFGWDFATSGDGEYAYATLAGQPLASIVAYDEDLGDAKGLWIPSLSIPDVDRAMVVVKGARGTVLEPPEDLAGRGRYLLVEDPTGAVVMLLRAAGGDPQRSGRVNGWHWNELWTDDPHAARVFYEKVIGYRTVSVKDARGSQYEIMGRDQQPYASLVEIPLPDVAPNWLSYLLVEDVSSTVRAVLDAGGAVLVAPQKDGFNEDVAIIADPTGGVVALQQKRETNR